MDRCDSSNRRRLHPAWSRRSTIYELAFTGETAINSRDDGESSAAANPGDVLSFPFIDCECLIVKGEMREKSSFNTGRTRREIGIAIGFFLLNEKFSAQNNSRLILNSASRRVLTRKRLQPTYQIGDPRRSAAWHNVAAQRRCADIYIAEAHERVSRISWRIIILETRHGSLVSVSRLVKQRRRCGRLLRVPSQK